MDIRVALEATENVFAELSESDESDEEMELLDPDWEEEYRLEDVDVVKYWGAKFREEVAHLRMSQSPLFKSFIFVLNLTQFHFRIKGLPFG